MLLTFKRMIGRNQTNFKRKIQDGQKIHTIRKKAWKPGTKIHFWEGNPRNTHLNPSPFFINPGSEIGRKIPLWTLEEQDGDFYKSIPQMCAVEKIEFDLTNSLIKVGNRYLTGAEIMVLSHNDGFDSVCEFSNYFEQLAKKEESQKLTLYINHWTLQSLYDAETAQISEQAKEARQIQF